jgi:hypothetical protein
MQLTNSCFGDIIMIRKLPITKSNPRGPRQVMLARRRGLEKPK